MLSPAGVSWAGRVLLQASLSCLEPVPAGLTAVARSGTLSSPQRIHCPNSTCFFHFYLSDLNDTVQHFFLKIRTIFELFSSHIICYWDEMVRLGERSMTVDVCFTRLVVRLIISPCAGQCSDGPLVETRCCVAEC